ncbi:MAG: glycosyltransferase [Melioribacteraceae bacterium]|nr:glycosyltransferase [Melioribacteraceae bacterium]WKZ69403.1 MAG: glycosyltransferase [Melioribacteraceae bacterium]
MSSYQYIFSVIVPTYNRSNEINELLNSLVNQTLDDSLFEVIIVDDGSTDNTDKVVNNVIDNSSINLRFLKQDHKGPGEARNLGMKEANGEYLLFIDSDCIADENWLTAYKIALEEKKLKPAGFGGPDKVLPTFSPVQKAIDYSMTSFITTGGIRGHSKKGISKYYPRSFNMGVRKDVYEKIGGMGKLRHGQDIEFSHRILSTGESVIKVDNAVVYHKRRMSIKKFFRQVFNWGVARINLYKIDKGMLEPVHFFPSIGTLLSLTVIILTLIFPKVFIWFVLFGLMILLSMGIHGIVKYKDYRTLFYIPVIVPTQIFGYGLGFLIAFVRRVILKKNEFTGFVKKYYQ